MSDIRIPFRRTRDGILIEVRVEPRSSGKYISSVTGTTLKVKLTAPPVGGAANEQLIEVLSESTGIRKSDISIVKGASSKKKIVAIRGVDSL